MRPLHVYLAVYFALIGGALLALWQAGVLPHLPRLWVVTGLLAAVGLGLLLALVSRRTPA